MTLQVTEEERQAIDRLKQLGFPEEMVIQGKDDFYSDFQVKFSILCL